MKFNLNHKNSVLFCMDEPKKISEQARFYAEACTFFCSEHDIYFGADTFDWLHGVSGSAVMAQWLNQKGWDVSVWKISGDDLGSPVAWGLQFNEACPRFIEAKLKGWRYLP